MSRFDGPTRYDNDEDQKRKMFVGGMPLNSGEDELRQHFEQFGELTDVVVMRDKATGRSRGFGFISFKDPESVDRVQANRPHLLENKEVETKRAMPRGDANRDDSHLRVEKLFVGGLKSGTDENDLRDYFSAYGKVTGVEVATDRETGNPRGFAFVTFEDSDCVDKVILYKPHNIGESVRVDCKKALSREQMAEIKARQSQMQMGPYMPGRGGPAPYMPPRGGAPYGGGYPGGYDDYNAGYGGGRGGGIVGDRGVYQSVDYDGGAADNYRYDDSFPTDYEGRYDIAASGKFNDAYDDLYSPVGHSGDIAYAGSRIRNANYNNHINNNYNTNSNSGFGNYVNQGYSGGPAKRMSSFGGGPQRFQPYAAATAGNNYRYRAGYPYRSGRGRTGY